MSTAENNIQIGGVCDAGNSFVTSNAFSGVVDEVRFWDVARTQAEIQSTMHTILTGTESGLAGYWQFNEGSGTVAHDLTANHNDGTLVNFTLNGTTDGWVPPFDQALKFGPGMYCSRGPFTTLTEPLTLECWVKWSGTTSSPTGECVVYNGNSGLNGYGLYMDNSGYLNALRGGYALGKTSYIPPIGTWVHLALVLSSDVWSLYANGVSQTLDDNTTGASTPAGVFLVGGNIYSTDLTLDYFNGDIDEVRISDVARYTGNFTPPSLPFTTDGNTIALYHFDEGSSATTAYDASGIGNDLTITGSPTNEVSLPVQAADFAAKSDIGSVTLSWKTQSEVDNAGFNIFREDPNTTFYKLVASYTNDVDLRGMGTSTTGQAYQFTDNKVTSGATYQYKIQSVSTNGTTKDLTTLSVTVDIPKNYALYQNYPNPFNPSTMIRFDLKQTSAVTLEIYNVLGQRVEYWNYGMTDAGRYNENVNLDTFASGVYFYRIDAVGGDGQRFESIKKLLLMK